ncbi:MAG: N-acetylmuramoyl-L-alanine amidase, partial [Alphaproteobacteria bacterium]|nr:N-acetylmuramoyl-L-alanine amidase [Alphaproteobacteria bacterium]
MAGFRRMHGLWRIRTTEWGVRERIAVALGLVVFAIALLAAGRGLASGSMGEILRVRFGGDAERTRVVVDLDRTARGQVIRAGDDGQVVLSLAGVSPPERRSGTGQGLVRGFRLAGAGTTSRLELDLATSAVIERRFLLPPGDGIAHYRYVIDLKATGRAPTRRAAPAP